jgi:hypothetical protein
MNNERWQITAKKKKEKRKTFATVMLMSSPSATLKKKRKKKTVYCKSALAELVQHKPLCQSLRKRRADKMACSALLAKCTEPGAGGGDFRSQTERILW